MFASLKAVPTSVIMLVYRRKALAPKCRTLLMIWDDRRAEVFWFDEGEGLPSLEVTLEEVNRYVYERETAPCE